MGQHGKQLEINKIANHAVIKFIQLSEYILINIFYLVALMRLWGNLSSNYGYIAESLKIIFSAAKEKQQLNVTIFCCFSLTELSLPALLVQSRTIICHQ
jgi:hypothetical protein